MRILQAILSIILILVSVEARPFTLFPHAASASDPERLYVWPLPDCPSQQQNFAPIVAGIAMILASDAIAALVNATTAPLTAGAAADKSGYQANGTNARFYFRALFDSSSKSYTAQPPRCYVVAYTKPIPASEGKSWCDDPAFSKSVPASCHNGGDLIGLLARQQGIDRHFNGTEPLDTPRFYAEIALIDSGYSSSDETFSIAQPMFVAMHYPSSLLGSVFERDKPRHMSLQLTFSSPAGGSQDPFKSATVNLDLFGFTPGESIPPEVLLNNTQAGWSAVPNLKVPKTYSNHDQTGVQTDGPFMPVSIVASLHEVGDESVFLQAFAGAFASQASNTAISNALTTGLLPNSQVALQNKASYQQALSKYYSSVSTYQSACAAYQKSKSKNDLLAAQSAYYGVQGSWSTVEASAVASETTKPNQEELKQCYP